MSTPGEFAKYAKQRAAATLEHQARVDASEAPSAQARHEKWTRDLEAQRERQLRRESEAVTRVTIEEQTDMAYREAFCPTPEKEPWATAEVPALLIRHFKSNGQDRTETLHVYSCPCGYFHLGHKDGLPHSAR